MAAGNKSQHNEIHRKLLLRRDLLASVSDGAFYVPFIGDGDIAVALYKGHPIYGADLDPARVKTAKRRLPGSTVRVFDCDAWPFPDVDVPFALADLDAYAHPYLALEAFLKAAKLTDRLVIFGTDGMRQAIKMSGILPELPSCKGPTGDLLERRKVYNGWWAEHVLPYLERTLAPRKITRTIKYQTTNMLYFGIVAELTPTLGPAPTGTDDRALVETALFEAAKSGNIPAITLWLDRHPIAPPVNPNGRPSKRTPEAREVILAALRAGNTRTHSAQAAGISLDTINDWEKAEPDFRTAVQKAQAEHVLAMLAHVTAAAPKSWQAAAWFLERRYWQDYGRRDLYREGDSGALSDVDAFLALPTTPDAPSEAPPEPDVE